MKSDMTYQEINSDTIDRWCREGWEWGKSISHDSFVEARNGKWDVLLTPTKAVPHEWFGDINGKHILGLASGGGQQIPVFAALGAECTLLDNSAVQCESDRMVAEREGYSVTIIKGDMTKPLQFPDASFDIIFHPVSNCYIREVEPLFRECYRVLRKGGVLLGGYDNGINYLFGEDETTVVHSLPFDPESDKEAYEECLRDDLGMQFSHTAEDQIGGQLRAGFRITDIYEDTNGEGLLHERNIPTFWAIRAIKD